jgi:hypothetical protein
MKANDPELRHWVKTGITEGELIQAAKQLIRQHLAGNDPQAIDTNLISEFYRFVEQEYPNPDRTGCPGTSALKRLAGGQIQGEEMLDHLMQCWPCLEEYRRLFRVQTAKAQATPSHKR